MSKYTTVGTGGPAEFFSRAGTSEELSELIAWSELNSQQLHVIGSGSNLLVADDGVAGLVIKLDGNLARIEFDGPRVECGGGARLPSVAAKAAAEGLTGLEFGVSIPGTVGGAVRMNANAYGGELARTLEWVDVATSSGTDRRTPDQFGFGYRRSNLAEGEVVFGASFVLGESESGKVKAELADLRARRKEAQPWGVKTFGSTFKNPDDEKAEGKSAGQLLDAAGCRDLRVGGAGLSEKHANFVVNFGDATTADVIAVMTAGRSKVYEEFGVALEPEVQTLGAVDIPSDWRDGQ
jgi:UDP-N-acetylmuramate dehydrogenase